MFKDFTQEEVSEAMKASWHAWQVFRKLSLKKRADFMRNISVQLEEMREALVESAAAETNLPEARLNAELTRTIFQMNSYAEFCESGQWMDLRIDTEDSNRIPPKPDLRKTMVPLGPVVVFGAANFPFAYSTAGGDTACAFAAGCTVIVKAHPGHHITSQLAATAVEKAVAHSALPHGVFKHVIGNESAVGEALVKHPFTKAVGFTGSFTGGKQLFDWGNQRKTPIPVFAEMSSVNPVFLLPEMTASEPAAIAKKLAASISLNAGQFCTNPGIIIGIDDDYLLNFQQMLTEHIAAVSPETMLHAGIYKNYVEKRASALSQAEVNTVAISVKDALWNEGMPTITTVTANDFIANPLLAQEVFGPYSIIVRCIDVTQMITVAEYLEGQLTATIMGSNEDIQQNEILVDTIKNICGRLILNGVPTGVEVCLAMQHGGPFPSSTDSRFTSVGADGIKRFTRPLSFQNWPDYLLPQELKEANPLKLVRTVNNVMGD